MIRILEVREATVAINAPMRNADIRFDDMTASAVVVVTDARRNGKPVLGLAFDSIGRYGHGGLLRERFIPRLMAASPEDYADEARDNIDPEKVWAILMRNEKLGGHGDRAGAVGVLEAAVWDAVAKIEDRPLWAVLAERYNGGRALERVPVYGSGGHYHEGDGIARLQDEIRATLDRGYRTVKIKVAGAPLGDDLKRIEAVIALTGSGERVAVDANASLSRERVIAFAGAIAPYGLAWIEEPLDPLDYALHRELAAIHERPIATGENVFSAADTRNLLLYGGLRPDRDMLQMDISLSYGIAEYRRIVALMEGQGWSRRQLVPHAGHLLSLNVVAGLGLGAHEAAPNAELIIGGLPDGMAVEDGSVALPEAPGTGIEAKANLYAVFRALIG